MNALSSTEVGLDLERPGRGNIPVLSVVMTTTVPSAAISPHSHFGCAFGMIVPGKWVKNVIGNILRCARIDFVATEGLAWVQN